MRRGELIVSVDLAPTARTRHFSYLKVRDRASFAFALVSVAVALDIVEGTIRSGRIALGGVAHKPWYARSASDALAGKSAGSLDAAALAVLALEGAQPLAQNAYKIPLARHAVARALEQALGSV